MLCKGKVFSSLINRLTLFQYVHVHVHTQHVCLSTPVPLVRSSDIITCTCTCIRTLYLAEWLWNGRAGVCVCWGGGRLGAGVCGGQGCVGELLNGLVNG